jgi:AraC-like DNA-binding protein
MKSFFHKPHPTLAPYIQGFVHVCIGPEKELAIQDIDLFPVGYGLLSFIFNSTFNLFNTTLNKKYSSRFNFSGQLDHYHHIKGSCWSVAYVLFKPFGAYRLLGVPQYLLKNESINMHDIMGNSINEVYAKMEDHAHHPKEAIKILEQWLLSQLDRNSKIDINRISFACNQVINKKGNILIGELNKMCCMSKSSMEQYFRDHVGISPKVYSRIIRFNEAKKVLKDAADKNWIEIVENYGYYDQAHFIHEFKHFFGYSPSQVHLSYQNLADHISSIKDL